MLRIDPETLDFPLPEELVAQEPLAQRDQARLIVIHRGTGRIEHRHFSNLGEYLRAGDLLVINKARVNRARVFGKKKSGGKVELLFLGPTDDKALWRALARPPLKEGTAVTLDGGFKGTIVGRTGEGEHLVRCEFDPMKAMEAAGRLPLPPYIKRAPSDLRSKMDEEYYQTVYAAAPGSVAAPTAGLHFTLDQLGALQKAGVRVADIVLHVGWGTFRPIAQSVATHTMLPERYEVPKVAMEEIVAARREGRRIVAVGTTATRTLESLPDDQKAEDVSAEASLFIRPGFSFRWTGALITNLHVPRSTPVSLTAAFAGIENLQRAYAEAVRERYRFYSYGDAMLVV
ncbi:MAG: tRNA preQ1(34) S-adenosylmethionine ribosyltransferase-isomerase QueA [Elusimicrobia bacterium]|nr:tRNA preQ1(34) S-adenosylmethionine ribosyltransferase-isomerase QueA [Elusimicrobiota bacterium]